jgi:hypothetical protein
MKVSHIGLLFGLIGLGLAMPTFASTASVCDAVSGNLVNNCGFELGNFTDWTTTAASSGSAFNVTNITGATGGPNSGSYDARFGATAGINDYIDQSFATTAGDYYTVSFYVSTNANGGVGTGQFVANWNGGNILTITNATQTGTGPDTAGYDLYSFIEQATSGTSDLEFGGNNKTSYYHLDDIVVTQNTSAVPEPSSVSFAVAGLFGILLVGRRYMQKRANS